MTRAQLGSGDRRLARWRDEGYLHPVYPGVYAVGCPAGGHEAMLAAALLYAGPGAMLSHLTAAHWIGALERCPAVVQVSTPRHRRSRPGVQVHGRRAPARIWLSRPSRGSARQPRLPLTPIPLLMLDLARILDGEQLRYALAQLDYRRLVDPAVIEAACGRGQRGSAALRVALQAHQPLLALTRSELERMLIRLCERHRLPLPACNVRFGRWLLDAVWYKQRVVVELDGEANHSSWAQIRRDRRKELELRAAGFVVLRYTHEQLRHDAERVVADLLAALQAGAA